MIILTFLKIILTILPIFLTYLGVCERQIDEYREMIRGQVEANVERKERVRAMEEYADLIRKQGDIFCIMVGAGGS